MDCRHAQQFVSPYLDQQLTGLEMLEMQQHLAECRQCAEEYAAARQIKILLRSVTVSRPETSLEERILNRLAEEERRGDLFLPMSTPRLALPAIWQAPSPLSLPPPSRGRRLTTAFALSCLAVFTVAAPFASTTIEVSPPAEQASSVSLGQTLPIGPVATGGMSVMSSFGGPLLRPAENGMAANAAPPSSQDVIFVQRCVQTPLSESGGEELGDEAVSGYVSGDVALVNYHPH